ncbi:MAG TPA: carboxyl transferase domain-containing protein, partial [Opitutales bacterium]|nr:carboxyl transferase domain-containing protein [Opitutales bacterium]
MGKSDYILEFERPLRDLDKQLAQLNELSVESNVDVSDEIRAIERKIQATKESIYSNLNPWQKVQIARHPKRPYTTDYIERVFTNFEELHGDRAFGDDRAIVGGTAFFEGRAVVVIGQQKGRGTKENLLRNFGCSHPEGYRKALRLIRMANKFELPLITLIDTPGAFPGIGAEERHVSEA